MITYIVSIAKVKGNCSATTGQNENYISLGKLHNFLGKQMKRKQLTCNTQTFK